MMPLPHDAWSLGRSLCNQPLNGTLASVSGAFRPLVEFLEQTPPGDRQLVWRAFLAGQPDRDAIVKAVADIDPLGPPPAPNASTRCYATLEDIARIVSAQPWFWRGWIASGVLNAVASDPGIG